MKRIFLGFAFLPLCAFATGTSYNMHPKTRIILHVDRVWPLQKDVTTDACRNNYGQSHEFSLSDQTFTNGDAVIDKFSQKFSNENGIIIDHCGGVSHSKFANKTEVSPFYCMAIRLSDDHEAHGVFHDSYCAGTYTYFIENKDSR